MQTNFLEDVEVIGRMDVVSTILEVICRTTGMGFAAVAKVTEDRWIACSVLDEINFGLLPGGELKVETTLCHEIRQSGNAVVIDKVSEDAVYSGHPTPAMYGFQSYISMPIIKKDGSFFGTLCAIDPNPAKLNSPQIIGMFKLYAELISFHLDAGEQLAYTQARLLEEQKTAQLREQFVAILSHDLRNPVGAVLNTAQMMMRMPLDDRLMHLANILLDSSYRMKGLIENVMDFASARLGGGISLDLNADEPVEKSLKHVINELQMIWPDKIIETTFNLKEPVNCDTKRLAQLFSNLLGNALTHGKADESVNVKVESKDGRFILSVINSGKNISAAAVERLFQPFSRGEVKAGQQGLGLGLYIAQEIARAHGGIIELTSGNDQTCFTLLMPTQQIS